MAGALYAVGGSKIDIGLKVAPKGEVGASDFTDAVWTEIGGWTNAGGLGDTQNITEQEFINENRVRKIKTTLNGGTMDNQFAPITDDPGQIKFREAIKSCSPYQFRVRWAAGCATGSTATLTIASPGVVTVAGGHGLEVGSPVSFSTTGSLPTGVVAGTTYYVVSAGFSSTQFSFAATPGGTAIVTTGTQSGTHTVTGQAKGSIDMFYGLAMPGQKAGGSASTAQMRNWSIAVDSNIYEA